MNKAKSNVYRDSLVVLFFAIIAKGIGFIKSIIQASFLGATIDTDAFNVANGFVNNILYMLSLAIAVSFVPLYTQHKLQGEGESKRFGTKVITALLLASVVITILLEIIAPIIVRVIAPSYGGDIFNNTVMYFRVLVLGFSFSLGAHIYSNLLNAEKVYGFSALCSISNSIVLILFIVILSGSIGVWSLVISVPVSFFVQWLVLYIKGRNYSRISFEYGIKDKAVLNLLAIATPVLISQATVEINQVVDKALLTSVGDGALTAVTYAAVLYQFATTLISAPLSSVMFTELSESGAVKDYDRMRLILNRCYKMLFNNY